MRGRCELCGGKKELYAIARIAPPKRGGTVGYCRPCYLRLRKMAKEMGLKPPQTKSVEGVRWLR